jgi:hypothetical protein
MPGENWERLRDTRFASWFDGTNGFKAGNVSDFFPITWKSSGSGTGRFTINDLNTAAFVGFSSDVFPIVLSEAQTRPNGARIDRLGTPFATLILTVADPSKLRADEEHMLSDADRLLLFAAGRTCNTDMAWNDKRTSVSDRWGKAPPRIEVVKATLTLPHDYTARALDSAGRPIRQFETINKTLSIGDAPTVWYELIRKKD